jgi:uncharacterized protein (UPF0548 family)
MRWFGDRRGLHDLEAEPFTYSPVGARGPDLPAGFHHLARSGVVGHGQADFDAAVQAVLGWGAQRGSGVRVEPSSPVARPGTVLRLHLGPGPLAVIAPARVVYVVDEPRRGGFAYGTLPGHPESGEESFLVELRAEDVVVFTVGSYSRPGTLLTRVAGPVNRAFQRFMAGRYLAAVRRAVEAAR